MTVDNSYLCILGRHYSIFPTDNVEPVDQPACDFHGTETPQSGHQENCRQLCCHLLEHQDQGKQLV